MQNQVPLVILSRYQLEKEKRKENATQLKKTSRRKINQALTSKTPNFVCRKPSNVNGKITGPNLVKSSIIYI
jgi:hypothetical protein